MANVVSINIYKINQKPPIPIADVRGIAFPTTQCLLRDASQDLTTRSLSTGVSVYSSIQFQNTLYYARETLAALVTLFG